MPKRLLGREALVGFLFGLVAVCCSLAVYSIVPCFFKGVPAVLLSSSFAICSLFIVGFFGLKLISSVNTSSFWIGLTLFFVSSVALALLNGTSGLMELCRGIFYPFQHDYGEGVILGQVLQLVSGNEIYLSTGSAPYRIDNYPPIYLWVVTAIAKKSVDLLVAGRLVSVISTLVMMTTSGLLCWTATRGFSRNGRLLGSVLASLTFTSFDYVTEWGVLMRVDMLAFALNFLGVLVFRYLWKSPWVIVASVPFFLSAAYTRQSVVSGAAACFLFLLTTRQYSRASWLLLSMATLASAFLLIGTMLTGGYFLENVVFGTMHSFSLRRMSSLTVQMLAEIAPLLFPTLVAVLLIFRQNDRSPGASLLLYLTLMSFFISLTVGKSGSNINYFIEFLFCVAALVGYVAAWAMFKAKQGAQTFVVLLVLLSIPLHTSITYARYLGAVEDDTSVEKHRAQEKVIRIIQGSKGIAISQEMVVLAKAGKEIFFQPFVMSEFSRQGAWDQTPILESLRSGEVELIVLLFDAFEEFPSYEPFFTIEFIKEMQASFSLEERYGDFFVYRFKGAKAVVKTD